MNSNGPYIVGVDAGGTTSTAWVGQAKTGTVLGKATHGAGNPRAVGLEKACENIHAAIRDAFVAANLNLVTAAAACLGVAGAGRAEEQDAVRGWFAETGMADRIRVITDAEAVLAAATPNDAGIVLICGTGSLAWGRNTEGETWRAGGWGYLLGDEGSAYSIALAGLQLAAKSADGRHPPTQLLPRLLSTLELEKPEELISRIYGSVNARQTVAALAKSVFDSAFEGDECANLILDDAASQLSGMVAAVHNQLAIPDNPVPLAVTGSVLTNQPDFLARILNHPNMPDVRSTIVHEPVSGALAMARQMQSHHE